MLLNAHVFHFFATLKILWRKGCYVIDPILLVTKMLLLYFPSAQPSGQLDHTSQALQSINKVAECLYLPYTGKVSLDVFL